MTVKIPSPADEERIDRIYRLRDHRKKQRMKISGKSVFGIQRIITGRAKRKPGTSPRNSRH
ncbi:MAG: hypothetical protein WC289_00455 [Patescibacteria group bacterium]